MNGKMSPPEYNYNYHKETWETRCYTFAGACSLSVHVYVLLMQVQLVKFHYRWRGISLYWTVSLWFTHLNRNKPVLIFRCLAIRCSTRSKPAYHVREMRGCDLRGKPNMLGLSPDDTRSPVVTWALSCVTVRACGHESIKKRPCGRRCSSTTVATSGAGGEGDFGLRGRGASQLQGGPLNQFEIGHISTTLLSWHMIALF